MLGRLISRALAYVAIGVCVSLLWVVFTEDATLSELRQYAENPSTALTLDFWPSLYWLVGGLLVALTAARMIGQILRPSTWSRQLRRTRELEAQGIPRAEAILTAADETERRRRRHSWRRGDQFLAVMFTDISGSTQLNERLGDARYAKVVSDHRALVRDATRRHGGTEVTTQGDGFFIRFDQPEPAVRCALDIQHRLADRPDDDGGDTPHVRIGIHCGQAIHGSDDVLGHVVTIGARLMEVAEGDDIIVTEPVIDRLELEVPVKDMGLVELKGVAHPRHLLALCWRDDQARHE
ncbi:MAG: adenylate/guanylate cyclase domain-containing protein [Acidimicrobiia bacterium]|nr:adenylate/guanylate cyclase domain-containing protein [Acidimicrobiia bacterium]